VEKMGNEVILLLFCSDVVHCGGRPGVDLKKEATYYRLHFYLQTEFQMAPDNEVNKFHMLVCVSLVFSSMPNKMKKSNFMPNKTKKPEMK
jgi:hypothetical protein